MPPDNPPRVLSPRAQLRLLLLAALAVAVGIALFEGISRLLRPGPEPAEAPVPAGYFRPTEEQWAGLDVARISAREFPRVVETDGKVAIDEDAEVPVFSPYSGRVTRVLAKAGDWVAQGAPLFALDASEFVQAQNDLVAAIAALKTARAQVDLARTNARRQQGLYAARGAALKDLQQSRVDLATAEGGLRTAEIALAAVRGRLRILGESEAEIDALSRSSVRANAGSEAVVTAPISGWVTQRQIGPGETIVSAANGGSSPVFTVADTSKVWLLAYVREADAPALRPGQEVEARLIAFPGRIFRGRLDYVAAGIDPVAHRLFVHAEIPNPGGALKPEMFADCRIITGSDGDRPAVPEEAVIYEGSAARVWVVGPDRTLGLRNIRAGRTEDGMVEVLAGLAAGESVVTRGSLFIDRAATAE